jgi:Ca2+-binding EF-hand superfamily protein
MRTDKHENYERFITKEELHRLANISIRDASEDEINWMFDLYDALPERAKTEKTDSTPI